jgi:DNA mismatch repair ATPase MutS
MRPRLLYRDRDFELRLRPSTRQNGADAAVPPPTLQRDLLQDLELEVLIKAMAAGDDYLETVARAVIPASLDEPDAIAYRQEVLADCLQHPALIRSLYAIAVRGVEAERTVWLGYTVRQPDMVLYRCRELLKLWLTQLRELRAFADEQRGIFRSRGLQSFLAMLSRELNEDYLSVLEAHAQTLSLRDGVLMKAGLSVGNKGNDYTLLCSELSESWMQRLGRWFGIDTSSALVYELAERDEAGAETVADMRRRAISAVARALGESTDHIMGFFWALRSELAFFVGCLNLHSRLTHKGEPTCMPEPLAPASALLSACGLYDVSLSLGVPDRLVGNRVQADGKLLIIIAGVNQGGKSTLLRAIGQAQLMMQAGMFVPATSFRANTCTGLYTHFKREEEKELRRGKLDEELRRMRAIVERLKPAALILLNESLASTNEREGSEIARQIVQACIDGGVKVIYVTHLFDLAQSFAQQHAPNMLFLRPERTPDGTRTYRVLEATPEPTSHGIDLYQQIFGPIQADRALGVASDSERTPASV